MFPSKLGFTITMDTLHDDNYNDDNDEDINKDEWEVEYLEEEDVKPKGEIDCHSEAPAFSDVTVLSSDEEVKEYSYYVTAEIDSNNEVDEEEDYVRNNAIINVQPKKAPVIEDPTDRDDCGVVRWTSRETREVIRVYKKYIPDLMAAGSFRAKRVVWNSIAAEVKMTPPRQCNAYIARTKVENMRKTFLKQVAGIGRPSWAYFGLMKEVSDAEMAARWAITQGTLPVSETKASDEELLNDDDNNVDDDDAPYWFRQIIYKSKKRHEEKMEIKRRFCSLLESMLDRLDND